MSLKLVPCFAVVLLSLTSCQNAGYQSTAPVPAKNSTPELVKASPEVSSASPEASPVAKAEGTKVSPEASPEAKAAIEAPVATPQGSDRPTTQALNAPKKSDRDTPEERTRRIETARAMDEDVLVLRNQNRTITIRGMQAWSGKNGTGDLGYESCDIDGKCLKLQGGTVTCSRGTCGMSWSNGDYGYGLTTAMDNPDRPTPNNGYTLTVIRGDKVILEEEGLTTQR